MRSRFCLLLLVALLGACGSAPSTSEALRFTSAPLAVTLAPASVSAASTAPGATGVMPSSPPTPNTPRATPTPTPAPYPLSEDPLFVTALARNGALHSLHGEGNGTFRITQVGIAQPLDDSIFSFRFDAQLPDRYRESFTRTSLPSASLPDGVPTTAFTLVVGSGVWTRSSPTGVWVPLAGTPAAPTITPRVGAQASAAPATLAFDPRAPLRDFKDAEVISRTSELLGVTPTTHFVLRTNLFRNGGADSLLGGKIRPGEGSSEEGELWLSAEGLVLRSRTKLDLVSGGVLASFTLTSTYNGWDEPVVPPIVAP